MRQLHSHTVESGCVTAAVAGSVGCTCERMESVREEETVQQTDAGKRTLVLLEEVEVTLCLCVCVLVCMQ